MPRLPFVRHRTANQVRAKYRACRHPTEKTRWQALLLLARTDEPRTPAQVAAGVGLSDGTVRDILHRWNDHGPAGRADRRKGNGAAPADPLGRKVLVLGVDRAGWHTAKRLAVPANVRLHPLPPCTPELQPVEPYWALVREAVANDPFDRQSDLRRVVRRRCGWLARNPRIVRGAIGFRWQSAWKGNHSTQDGMTSARGADRSRSSRSPTVTSGSTRPATRTRPTSSWPPRSR